jgi:hypothetical protein
MSGVPFPIFNEVSMRLLTGTLFLLGAEQAFSHAHLVGFPHAAYAREILLPTSAVFVFFGLIFLIWGILTEHRKAKE